ncbi:hypothetical protein RND71_037149 [Anisodus tanguticus]|uniref:Uncharacterized protein n=1 Tax=Anisodus tanguticus TaxID=243964 RepID=A0AAE1R2I7_9SOLA|nr:hypothetical protein RND71_037149 [Anisodus tanguticus]
MHVAGEPFINGQAVPYDPKYHEEWVRNNARANERNRPNDRPRNFDRSRNFETRREMQNQPSQNPRPNMGAGGPPNMRNAPPPNMGGMHQKQGMGGPPNTGGMHQQHGMGCHPTPVRGMGGPPNMGGMHQPCMGVPPNMGGMNQPGMGGPPRGGGMQQPNMPPTWEVHHQTWVECLSITTECQTTHLISNTMVDQTVEAHLTKQVQDQTRAMLLIHLMGTPIRITTYLEEIYPLLITNKQV